MIIELARDKGTNNEIGSLERLMHRRRLMNAARNRLKIGNVQNPGVLIAIPTNDIAGMKIVPVTCQRATDFDTNLKFATFSMGSQLLRSTNIAFTIRGMF